MYRGRSKYYKLSTYCREELHQPTSNSKLRLLDLVSIWTTAIKCQIIRNNDMKENLRKYIVLEIIILPGFLQLVILLWTEFLCRRYQQNNYIATLSNYISALSYSLTLLTLFLLHEFLVKILEKNVDSVENFYVYV